MHRQSCHHIYGQRVANGGQGVEVTGYACNMNGRTGWLFDYDYDADNGDGYYYLNYTGSSHDPAIPGNGTGILAILTSEIRAIVTGSMELR